jgi:hypothetical protein
MKNPFEIVFPSNLGLLCKSASKKKVFGGARSFRQLAVLSIRTKVRSKEVKR